MRRFDGKDLLKNINQLTLENAKVYFDNNDYKIKKIQLDNVIDVIEINVNGYCVECAFNHEQLVDHSCQCMIGKNHIICKHIALAILVYIQNKSTIVEDQLLNQLLNLKISNNLINYFLWLKNEDKFFNIKINDTKLSIDVLDNKQMQFIIDNKKQFLDIIEQLLKHYPSEQTINELKIKLNKILYFYELKQLLSSSYWTYIKNIDYDLFNSYLDIANLELNHKLYTNKLTYSNSNCFRIETIKNNTDYIINTQINNGSYILTSDFLVYYIYLNNHVVQWFKVMWKERWDPNLIFKLNFNTKNLKSFIKRLDLIEHNNYFVSVYTNNQWIKNFVVNIEFIYNQELNLCELIIDDNQLNTEHYFNKIISSFRKENNKLVYQTNNYEMIKKIIDELKIIKKNKNANVYIDPIFKKEKKYKNKFNFNLNENWINLKITNEIDQDIFSRIYEAFLRKERFIKIENEVYDVDAFNFLEIQDKVNELKHELNINNNKLEFSFKKENIFYLNNLFNEKKLLTTINEFYDDLNKQDYLFKDKDKVLKPYQLYGVNWMIKIIQTFHGCILADEMGLGKTIQIIYLLEYLSKQSNEPTLIIVPTTLINNWINEFKKFKPNLKVVEIHGNSNKRREIINNIKNDKTIYITSYSLINYDFDILYNKSFYNIILDEGQNIKNHETNWTQKITKIKAVNRIVITGTPIENNLLDIWSLFNFILPDYLEPLKEFKNKYIANNSEVNFLNLSLKIKPFILQRKKEEYLDLPNKYIHNVFLDMDEQNQKYYQQIVNSIKHSIKENENKIYILSLITKLRLFCCSPWLLDLKELKQIKLIYAVELIKQIIHQDKNNKIVIFSNFSSSLKLLQDLLNDHHINNLLITYETKKENRLAIINEFKTNNQTQVLLMSLKVGGVGLNLSFANNIILLNPWWNEAAELQAIDRLHRIGQEKKIDIYKLIFNNSIEQNMEKLKESKIDIISKTLNNLSLDEILKLIMN